jgi:hypothetical protein
MNKHFVSRSMRQAFAACLICGALFLGSCANTKIVTAYDCADAINKDTTVWHFLWGLKQAKDIRPNCDPRYNHLNSVTVKTRAVHVLVTVITLGIAIPQKVTWCCAPPNTTPGPRLGQ